MAKSRHKSNRRRSQVGSGGGLQDASYLECPDCGNPIGNHNWKSSRGKKNARLRSVRTRSRKGSTGQRSYIRRRYTRSPNRRRAKRGAKRGGRRTVRSRSTCATRSRRSASGKRGKRTKTRGKRGRSTHGRNVSRASSHARSVCSSSRVRCQRSTTRKQQSQSSISRKGSTNKRRYVRPCRGVRAKRAGRRTARSQSSQSQSTTPRKGSNNKRRYVRRPANRRGGRAKRGARRTVTRSRSSTSSSSRGRSSTLGKQRAKQSTNRYKRGRGTKYYRGRQAPSRTSRKSKSSRPTKMKRSRRPTRLGICTCCHQKIKSTDSTQAVADPEQELAPDSARLSSSSELSIREEQEQPSTTEAPEQQERPSSELSLSEPLTTTNVPTSTPLIVDDDHNNRIPIPETNTAPEVRTIIFRPTIVIVQNVFVLPGQLQASSSNQNSLNVVNVLNQEVFIFPNSNELPSNIGAQYGLVNAPTFNNQTQTVSPASSSVPSSSVAPQSSATSDKPVPPQ